MSANIKRMPGSLAVDARGLTHSYATPGGELTVLDGLSLEVETGDHIAVMGRSGSGKSTLLALLGGLAKPQAGTLRVQGHDLAELAGDDLAAFRRDEIGFVFQHFGLLDTLTAAENVELACSLAGVRAGARRIRSSELLEAVGLAARGRHRPHQLSGGERQRVAIARALANEPRLVLADEPTGNLDDEAAAMVAELLASLPAERGVTVITVTHDVVLAGSAARRVHLDRGRAA
jgi:putative ABC transport system ATP-binding protein